ncbi:MAG: patatin-like phospholipase family protein [Patescibacteria group bacterium]
MTTIADLGKIGLVLPGGFLRGAFQAGALKAFHERGIRPSYIVGVSVGALNGAAFAAGKMDSLLSLYEAATPRPSKFLYDWNLAGLLRLFFWSESVFVAGPLRRLIEKQLGLGDLMASDIKLDIIATDFQDGTEVVFSNHNPDHRDPKLLTEALLASAAMPVVFPPIIYRDHQLFDGGVIQENPISYAIREGCDTIFVILTDSQEHMRTEKLFHSIYFIARRAGNIVSWRATRKDIRRGMEINRNLEAYQDLEAAVAGALRRHLTDERARDEMDDAVRRIFAHRRFSFQEKRRVRLAVIEPDPASESESYALFKLTQKTVPEYLAEGYRKTMATFEELKIVVHDRAEEQ